MSDPETKRLERRLEQMTAVLEITRRLRRPFDPDELLDEIVAISRDTLAVEACSLLLAEPRERALRFHSASGGREDAVKSIGPIPYGMGVAGWVAEHQEVAIVNDVRSDPRFGREIDRAVDFKTESILAVPLTDDEGNLLGVIEGLNKKDGQPFDEYDRALFEMLAGQAAAAIQHVRKEAERRRDVRLATIGTMASSIIHDIKNPMASIKGFAQLIANRSPENRRYAEIIVREIDRLVGMTQELLDFSKGAQEVQVAPVDLGAFVRDAVGFLERNLEAAGITVATSLGYEGEVRFDRNKVMRAILNIASNALDAMPSGGSFSLATEADDREIRIRLSDTGCGMTREVVARVFDPFYSTKDGRGTGLGLSIVAAAMEAHRGRVEVETEPGSGTTFTLAFPRTGSVASES